MTRLAAVLVAALTCVACSTEQAVFEGDGGDHSTVGVGGAGSGGAGGTAPASSSSTGAGGPTSSSSSATTSGTGGAGGGPQPECATALDCPGDDGECHARTCDGGVCGVAYAPLGAPAGQQTPGDCYTSACDGAGAITQVYAPGDLPGDAGCSTCTPSGPGLQPIATACIATCGCPQQNGGVCGASQFWPCTQGLCDGAGTCVDHLPVTCVTLQFKNGTNTYTRCDLTSSAFSIGWGNTDPACQQDPDSCGCNTGPWDVGYCTPGTTCYVYDSNGWLGPQQGTGTCQ